MARRGSHASVLVLEVDERFVPRHGREAARPLRERGGVVTLPAQAQVAPVRGRLEWGHEIVRLGDAERGATRMDDRTSDASMERRKKEGYF